MTLVLSQPIAAHNITSTRTVSPAWLEIERLRSQRHLLTIRTSSSAMGVEREKERRRKERQWQRWQTAMDMALDALRQEVQVPSCVEQRRLPPTPPSPQYDLVMAAPIKSQPTVPLTLSLSKIDQTKRETDRFPSRSPTVCGPSPRSKRPTLKIVIDYVYAFTFTCPAGPVWPQKRVDTLSGTTLRGSSSANCCSDDHKGVLALDAESPVVSEATEEQIETLALGARLLERQRPAVRAKVHRKTLWRNHCRRVADSINC
ncbi:hypothetical protein FRC16_005623 [Serendipita sp. 398]|nr:hypothetical protein FRC16_005623 [Serendipita sp. 398]